MSFVQDSLFKLINVSNGEIKFEDINSLVSSLERYLDLLEKWNKTYNLTAIRDREEMVCRHILDSLAILPWIKGTRIIDVGTGAGLPGIPLSLANPNLQVVLLDSNGKKTRFLQEVKRVLRLNNVLIINSRVEDYKNNFSFDTVVSRAFTNLKNMLEKTEHLLDKDGIWLAMKGIKPEEELTQITNNYQIINYKVADDLANRCCI